MKRFLAIVALVFLVSSVSYGRGLNRLDAGHMFKAPQGKIVALNAAQMKGAEGASWSNAAMGALNGGAAYAGGAWHNRSWSTRSFAASVFGGGVAGFFGDSAWGAFIGGWISAW